MITLDQARMKRITAVHGWSSVVLGLLLYVVVFTGTVAVLAHEIGHWSVGGPKVTAPLEGLVDQHVRRLSREVPPRYHEDISVWHDEEGDLRIFFHAHATHPDTAEEADLGVLYELDAATGDVLARQEGFVFDDPNVATESALGAFLIDIHVNLYLGYPWGDLLVGILGLAMLAAAVSGFLMHKHLIRDMFVAERAGARLVSARDRHVLASTWSLPFAIILAFTGAFYGLAWTVTMPLITEAAFGGDEDAAAARMWEAPVAEDTRPAQMANIDYILVDSVARTPGAVYSVDLVNWGRADARVIVWRKPSDGGLFWFAHEFDGVTRAFLGQKPSLGTVPSVGGTLYDLMWPLHVGDFAGWLSKFVWVGLGGATCFVIISGLRLWVRRRSEDRLWRRYHFAILAVGWGVPLGMLLAAHAFFLSLPAGDPFFWTPAGFLIGAIASIAMAARASDASKLRRRFAILVASMLLALPLVRHFMGGLSIAEALIMSRADVLAIEILLLAIGSGMLIAMTRGAGDHRTTEPELTNST
ncbi:MAG: PepSY-associated TM helix domain-containing protein [Pseudomonadota bacterium]